MVTRNNSLAASDDSAIYENHANPSTDNRRSDDVIVHLQKTSDQGSAPPSARLPTGRKSKKHFDDDERDEPLIDTTAALSLHSKKLERLEKKRLEKAAKKAKYEAQKAAFVNLPPELLHEIFSHLRPNDLAGLERLNKATREFIQDNQGTLAKDIIQRRYWVLSKCLPLPISFLDIDGTAHAALLSDSRQAMLAIHKKPYQHVLGVNPYHICTCMTCVLAWNNLCMVVDLAHWQKNLNNREPITMIPRGTNPQWNQDLLEKNARIVSESMRNPLTYAAILQKHLISTTGTILRRSKWMKKPVTAESRLYHLSEEEAASETDEFLERKGPPSYEFPFHRDNYYNVEAYVPNRRWLETEGRWVYYHATQHQRDLEWVKERFAPSPSAGNNSSNVQM